MKKIILASIILGAVVFSFVPFTEVQVKPVQAQDALSYNVFNIFGTDCSFTSGSGVVDPKTGKTFTSSSCKPKLLAEYMVALIEFFFRLAIALAVLMIVIGGFQWLLAIGNASKISNAKETLQQAIIGLILALTATLLFSQIDKSFVNLEPGRLNLEFDTLSADNCQTIKSLPICVSRSDCTWTCNDQTVIGEGDPPATKCGTPDPANYITGCNSIGDTGSTGQDGRCNNISSGSGCEVYTDSSLFFVGEIDCQRNPCSSVINQATCVWQAIGINGGGTCSAP